MDTGKATADERMNLLIQCSRPITFPVHVITHQCLPAWIPKARIPQNPLPPAQWPRSHRKLIPPVRVDKCSRSQLFSSLVGIKSKVYISPGSQSRIQSHSGRCDNIPPRLLSLPCLTSHSPSGVPFFQINSWHVYYWLKIWIWWNWNSDGDIKVSPALTHFK